MKINLVIILSSLPYVSAITSNYWENYNSNYYVFVTAYYIDYDWILQKETISFRKLIFLIPLLILTS